MQDLRDQKIKIPPNNLEAERALLGSVLLNSEVLPSVIEILKPADFYNKNHSIIFDSLVSLFEKNQPIDILTLKDNLLSKGTLEQVGGDIYLSDIVNSTVTSANAATYAKIVKEKAMLRNMIRTAEWIVESGYDRIDDAEEFLDKAETDIFRVSEERSTTSYHQMRDMVSLVLKEIEGLTEDRKLTRGVPSGFNDLDGTTLGFQPSDLIIIAARPGMGKTSLCLNIAHNAAVRGKKGVAVFSLEMSKEQLAMRLLCSHARVDLFRLRSGILRSDEYSAIAKTAGILADAPIYIDDSPGISSLELRAKARRLKYELKDGLSMIIVDYLQLMRGRGSANTREQEISEISRSLKFLAKELKIPVIAISQLNRALEARDDKRPRLADLRESGAIEQDADLILFIYRDELYKRGEISEDERGKAEVIIGKNRNGPTGKVELVFLKEFTRFEDLARGY
jgi:replicative DNA helicase